MRSITISRILSLAFMFTVPSIVHAKISCSSSSVCTNTSLVALNQNSTELMSSWNVNGGTMLCGPTAVAMALNTFLRDGFSVKSGTAMSTYKSYASNTTRIEYLSRLMGTTKNGGTSRDSLHAQYSNRAVEFNSTFTSSSVFNSPTVSVNPTAFLNQMKEGKNPVYLMGRYTQSCQALIDGSLRCTLARSGGHFMAVKGADSIRNQVTFNDPWGAATFTQTFKKLPNQSSTGQAISYVLPSLFSISTANYGYAVSGTYNLAEFSVAVGGSANRGR